MNIFVAKLNPKTTAESLKDLFSNFGEVSSSKVIMDKTTGFSKRYGFVEMPNEEEAREAIAKLNDSTFENSVIVVKESLPKEEYLKTKNPNDKSI
ncbi:MAG: RNA-binding protein [Bacteroidales bacterium]|nr:RNA-binding protein [Bacteroidales bacterium]